MIKVYLKGFDRPISVVGERLYEDERYFVITSGGVRNKLLWENILYFEEIISDAPVATKNDVGVTSTGVTDLKDKIAEKIKEGMENAKASKKNSRVKRDREPVPPKAVPSMPEVPGLPGISGLIGGAGFDGIDLSRISQIDPVEEKHYDPDDTMDVAVTFSGYKTDTIGISIPRGVWTGKYNPALASEVFSNSNIRSVMGDFVLKGVPRVEGETIYLETQATKDLTDKVSMAADMMGSALKHAENQYGPKPMPSLAIDDDFGIPGSTFDKPVTFSA